MRLLKFKFWKGQRGDVSGKMHSKEGGDLYVNPDSVICVFAGRHPNQTVVTLPDDVEVHIYGQCPEIVKAFVIGGA